MAPSDDTLRKAKPLPCMRIGPTPVENAMYDLAHVCPSCRTITIFNNDAAYPRRCGACDAVVRASPSEARFVARPVWEDDEDDLRFDLELGPATMEAAPF